MSNLDVSQKDSSAVLEIERWTKFEGPNVWSDHPTVVIELTDPWPVGITMDVVSDLAEAINNGMPRIAMDPTISSFRESAASSDDGVPAGRAFEHLLGLLGRSCPLPIVFARSPSSTFSRPVLLVGVAEDRLRVLAETTVLLLNQRMQCNPTWQLTLDDFLNQIRPKLKPKAAQVATLTAADRRGIPIERISGDRQLIALGTGRHRHHVINHAASTTAVVGRPLTSNKHLTSALLSRAGIPVPRSLLASTAQDAVNAARGIGFPVVMKPLARNHSRGVFVDIRTERQVESLFPSVLSEGNGHPVLVEQHLQGNDYRILVVGGEVAAVLERVPGTVTGDGVATIEELIDRENMKPERYPEQLDRGWPIEIDRYLLETLDRLGYTLQSVPASRRPVRLQQVPNLSGGGYPEDRTDLIHDHNAKAVTQAAAVLGLDIAGIDLIIPDIEQSLYDTGGGIVEVNSGPAYSTSLHPMVGTPRDIGASVMSMLYPGNRAFSVPVVAAMGVDANTICELAGAMLEESGVSVGVATRDRIRVAGMELPASDASVVERARLVNRNPETEILVAEVDARELRDTGLGFASCAVALISTLSGFTRKNGDPVEAILLDQVSPGGSVFRGPSLGPEVFSPSHATMNRIEDGDLPTGIIEKLVSAAIHELSPSR